MINLEKEWHCYLKRGNSKELIKQVNECFNEEEITKNANTYYVEVCE